MPHSVLPLETKKWNDAKKIEERYELASKAIKEGTYKKISHVANAYQFNYWTCIYIYYFSIY